MYGPLGVATDTPACGRSCSYSDQPPPMFTERPFAPTTRILVTCFADAAAGRSITTTATTTVQRQITAVRVYAAGRGRSPRARINSGYARGLGAAKTACRPRRSRTALAASATP